MDETFRDMFEGLRQTAQGLITANEGLIAANEGIKRVVISALVLPASYWQLRETVSRLETLVMELGRDVRALRDQLGGSTS